MRLPQERQKDFNPRAPRGARPNLITIGLITRNFNPRAPRGARRRRSKTNATTKYNFNPRAPRGARLLIEPRLLNGATYFNPRAPRGARPSLSQRYSTPLRISIHVPREGHDASPPIPGRRDIKISIHVPREGHDGGKWYRHIRQRHFNPRAPRGARLDTTKGSVKLVTFQSTCPARGTTRQQGQYRHRQSISIHVPREGHDICHRKQAR